MNPTVYKLIEPVFATAFGGISGAFLGRTAGMVTAPRNPRARTQYVRACAREFSAASAAMLGTGSIMRGIRGKDDDLTSRVVSGSAAGLAVSFAMKGWKLKPPYALSWAASFAVFSGTISLNAQDDFYTEARAMLSKLSLEKYEKNFKKGHFIDLTLPLLTDRELQEMNIPPGARLLILYHIKRYHKRW
ncbi:hypothetical protein Bca52824_034601 [Brassica carinata]|uniref:SAM domain-containing protein n=1 Tax=Brassica carinata TaxID=52824 RepID=A0A8X7S069_BRACI|nr:hypothetical protein Bca52824_034601 [Brassica carinata]